MSGQKTVLIVDDNQSVRSMIVRQLTRVGYRVLEAADGVQGLQTALAEKPQLIILDVLMPGFDGFKLCEMLRSHNLTAPVLMLTERTDIEDKKRGFGSGADDYLAKPFDPIEVELRVEALLRRPPGNGHGLKFGEMFIDLKGHKVTIRDREVGLTPIEFEILKLLARNPGTVFSRDDILHAIWETSYEGYKRNIDPHVNRLRVKLEDNPKKPKYVLTVWGVGYKFNELLSEEERP